MFGLFRNRKKFNGDVDTKVNNEYDIATRDNPLFPGINSYLSILDQAWSVKMTEDEAAMYVATLYYCGLLKAGRHDLANKFSTRLASVPQFGLQRGTISMQHSQICLAHIEKSRSQID